jgi:hypothetical protein
LEARTPSYSFQGPTNPDSFQVRMRKFIKLAFEVGVLSCKHVFWLLVRYSRFFLSYSYLYRRFLYFYMYIILVFIPILQFWIFFFSCTSYRAHQQQRQSSLVEVRRPIASFVQRRFGETIIHIILIEIVCVEEWSVFDCVVK